MSKVRVYELSKELNISSKLIVEKAKEFGISVSNLSAVDEEFASKIRNAFSPEKPNAKEESSVLVSDKTEKTEAKSKLLSLIRIGQLKDSLSLSLTGNLSVLKIPETDRILKNLRDLKRNSLNMYPMIIGKSQMKETTSRKL